MQLDAAAVAADQLTSVWDHSAWDLVESGTLGTLGTSLGHRRNHPAMTGGKGGRGRGERGKGKGRATCRGSLATLMGHLLVAVPPRSLTFRKSKPSMYQIDQQKAPKILEARRLVVRRV